MPFATGTATPSDRDLAATVAQLHLDLSAQPSLPSGSVGPVDQVGPVDLAGLIDLSVWFSSLLSMTTTPPELPAWAATTLNLAQDTAHRLLAATPADSGPLHGDVHHSNLLNFTTTAGDPGQWKYIDPKGLTGDRTFDYVNIIFNPDLGHSANEALFTRRVAGIGKQAHLEHAHYVRWILACGGLSALWHLEDSSPEQALATLKVARLAQAQLGL